MSFTWRLRMPNLSNRNRSCYQLIPFLRRSAICSLLSFFMGITSLDSTLSRIKYQSISTCLIRSWNTRLFAIWWAAWLSQNKGDGAGRWIPRSLRNHLTHNISLKVEPIARYFASAEKNETQQIVSLVSRISGHLLIR